MSSLSLLSKCSTKKSSPGSVFSSFIGQYFLHDVRTMLFDCVRQSLATLVRNFDAVFDFKPGVLPHHLDAPLHLVRETLSDKFRRQGGVQRS